MKVEGGGGEGEREGERNLRNSSPSDIQPQAPTSGMFSNFLQKLEQSARGQVYQKARALLSSAQSCLWLAPRGYLAFWDLDPNSKAKRVHSLPSAWSSFSLGHYLPPPSLQPSILLKKASTCLPEPPSFQPPTG